MGNENSKTSTNTSDSDLESRLLHCFQVPNNSPALDKTSNALTTVVDIHASKEEDEDENSSLISDSASDESSGHSNDSITIDLGDVGLGNFTSVAITSPNAYPFPTLSCNPEQAHEQTLKALDNLSLQVESPDYPLLTPPAGPELQLPIVPEVLVASVRTSPVLDAGVVEMPNEIVAEGSLEIYLAAVSASSMHQVAIIETPAIEEPGASEEQPSSNINSVALFDSSLIAGATELVQVQDVITIAEADVPVSPVETSIPDALEQSACDISSSEPADDREIPCPVLVSTLVAFEFVPNRRLRSVPKLQRDAPEFMPQEGSTEFLVVVKGTEEINLRDHSPDGPAENAFVYPTPPADGPRRAIPTATTYAEATNLALQYPELASVILEKPLASSASATPTPQDTCGAPPKASRRTRGPSTYTEFVPRNRTMINSAATDRANTVTHIPDTEPKRDRPSPRTNTSGSPSGYESGGAPNWAAAPLPSSAERQRGLRMDPGRWRNRSNRHNDHNGRHDGEVVSVSCHAPESYLESRRPPPHQYSSFENHVHNGWSAHGAGDINVWDAENRPTEFSTVQNRVLQSRGDDAGQSTCGSGRAPETDAWDHRLVTPFGEASLIRNDFAQGPTGRESLRIVTDLPGPLPADPENNTAEQEALKLLALARLHNLDLAELVRLASTSKQPQQAKTEEEEFHEQFKGTRKLSLAPAARSSHGAAEMVHDVFWNTPEDMLPHNSWGDSSATASAAAPATSPSSVFVPAPASNPMALHERGYSGGRTAAAVLNKTSLWTEAKDGDRMSEWSARKVSENIRVEVAVGPHSRSRGSTGDRRVPSSQFSRSGNAAKPKFDENAENVSFEVVEKLESGDGQKDGAVFLRHGSHFSTKPVSPAIGHTRSHAEHVYLPTRDCLGVASDDGGH